MASAAAPPATPAGATAPPAAARAAGYGVEGRQGGQEGGRQREADGGRKKKVKGEKREWRRSTGPTHVTEAKKIDRSHQKLQSECKIIIGYKRCIF